MLYCAETWQIQNCQQLLQCYTAGGRNCCGYSVQQQSLDKQLQDCVYQDDFIAALHWTENQAKQLPQQYLVNSTC